jgi:hypothetical protein
MILSERQKLKTGAIEGFEVMMERCFGSDDDLRCADSSCVSSVWLLVATALARGDGSTGDYIFGGAARVPSLVFQGENIMYSLYLLYLSMTLFK